MSSASSLPNAFTEKGQVGSRNISNTRGPWPQTRGSARQFCFTCCPCSLGSAASRPVRKEREDLGPLEATQARPALHGIRRLHAPVQATFSAEKDGQKHPGLRSAEVASEDSACLVEIMPAAATHVGRRHPTLGKRDAD